jgi:peptidoglycan biosynthesis protein MviN/MurJ (putative lipid II flippase)
MGWFSSDLARLAFGWGVMSKETVLEIGTLVAVGFLSLPAQGISSLVVSTFNAKRDTATPLYINLAGFTFFLPVGWFAAQVYGLKGIMSAMVISYYIIMLVQIFCLQVRHSIFLWSELLSWRVVKICLVGIFVFVPIAKISVLLKFGELANSLWACCAFLLLILSGVLITKEYRTQLFNFMIKAKL